MVTQRTLTPLCEGSIPSALVAHGRRNKRTFTVNDVIVSGAE